MPDLAIDLHSLHPGQQRIRREARRFNVVSAGRRFGKTIFGLDLLVDNPGKGALDGFPQGWFAPSYKLLDEAWRYALKVLKPLIRRTDSQLKRIELVTGGTLDFWTTESGDCGRGRKYKQVFVDEAAAEKNLRKVWDEAIRPTLADLEGDAWFFSTPKGLNDFYDLRCMGQAGHQKYDSDWMSWIIPTSTNPHIKASEIEAARKSYAHAPLIFRQEWLGEFIGSVGAVFNLDWIKRGKIPQLSHLYTSWDLAVTAKDKERGDYTAGGVIGQDALGRYWLKDLVRERWDSSDVVENMLRMARKNNAVRNWFEGGPIGAAIEPFLRKRMQENGEIFNFQTVQHSGRGDKVVRCGPLAAIMKSGNFYIDNDAPWAGALFDELAAFPNGKHDDQVDLLSQAFLELQAIRKSDVDAPPATSPTARRVVVVRGEDLRGPPDPPKRKKAY